MITRDEVLAAIDSAQRAGLEPFVFVVPISPQVLEQHTLAHDEVELFLRARLERHVRDLVVGGRDVVVRREVTS